MDKEIYSSDVGCFSRLAFNEPHAGKKCSSISTLNLQNLWCLPLYLFLHTPLLIGDSSGMLPDIDTTAQI